MYYYVAPITLLFSGGASPSPTVISFPLSDYAIYRLHEKRQSQLSAMTALLFSLSLCVTPLLCYLSVITNISKGGNCRAPQALSRCRLLRRRCLHTVSPSCRHRHSVLRYCPYIRQQGSFLPSYPRLYLPQWHNRSRYCRTVRQYTA